jgi:hypothetical protein
VFCTNSSFTVLSDASCASAGPKPATLEPCPGCP